MQLMLFQWDMIEIGEGYISLARLDFNYVRRRFNLVLQGLPEHPEAMRGMRDLQFWEDVFLDLAGMEAEMAAPFLWESISRFFFAKSDTHQTLRLHLIRRLLGLLENRPFFYSPPDLCRGCLYLQIENYVAAEASLRDVLGYLPENGRLHGYLADALWMQGRSEVAGVAYMSRPCCLRRRMSPWRPCVIGHWLPLLKNTGPPWRRFMVFSRDFFPWLRRKRNRSAGKAGSINCCVRPNRHDASAITRVW